MEKLYFKTEGAGLNVGCVDKCKWMSGNIMIGSARCHDCINCRGWDYEENWVKCYWHDIEKNLDTHSNEVKP